MDVDVWNALGSCFAVGLNYIDPIRLKDVSEASGHRVRCKHNLSHLIAGQIRELLNVAMWGNHTMAKHGWFSREERDDSVVAGNFPHLWVTPSNDGAEGTAANFTRHGRLYPCATHVKRFFAMSAYLSDELNPEGSNTGTPE